MRRRKNTLVAKKERPPTISGVEREPRAPRRRANIGDSVCERPNLCGGDRGTQSAAETESARRGFREALRGDAA
eukprot:4143030-Alexandrium_andersonii.AAC.1